MMTIQDTPNVNIVTNNGPHDKIMDRQPACTSNTNNNQTMTPMTKLWTGNQPAPQTQITIVV